MGLSFVSVASLANTPTQVEHAVQMVATPEEMERAAKRRRVDEKELERL